MDFLFNRRLTEDQAEIMEDDYQYNQITIDGYSISKSMIVEDIIYRFKTRDEMEKTIGSAWYEYDGFDWIPEMNDFFGKEVSKQFYDEVMIDRDGSYNGYHVWYGWLTDSSKCTTTQEDESEYDETEYNDCKKELMAYVDDIANDVDEDDVDWNEAAEDFDCFDKSIIDKLCEEYEVPNWKLRKLPSKLRLIVRGMVKEIHQEKEDDNFFKAMKLDDDEVKKQKDIIKEMSKGERSLTEKEIDKRIHAVASEIEDKFVDRVDAFLESMFDKYEKDYGEKVDSKIEGAMRDYAQTIQFKLDNKESAERLEVLRRQLQMVAGSDGFDWDSLVEKIKGYENELKCLCVEYHIQDWQYLDMSLVIKRIVERMRKFTPRKGVLERMGEKMTDELDKVDTAMVNQMDKLMEQEDEDFLNVITGEDKMSEGKVTTVDAALQLGKKMWKKNAIINASAAKLAAKIKIGKIVNDKLVDLILKNVDMPKWVAMIGGKKILRPIIKILVSNFGILSTSLFELQGYKSSKIEFISEAMVQDGYITLTKLINMDNVSSIIDKFIEAVPDSLLNEAGFDGDKFNSGDE